MLWLACFFLSFNKSSMLIRYKVSRLILTTNYTIVAKQYKRVLIIANITTYTIKRGKRKRDHFYRKLMKSKERLKHSVKKNIKTTYYQYLLDILGLDEESGDANQFYFLKFKDRCPGNCSSENGS